MAINGITWECYLQELAVIHYLLIPPKVAANIVLYREWCIERVIKPDATSLVKKKWLRNVLSWKDHSEGHVSGLDTVTIEVWHYWQEENKGRLGFQEEEE